MIACIADTETTGHHEEQERPEIIELAYAEIEWDEFALKEIHCQRYRPVVNEITFGALATHHILPQDLESCELVSEQARIPAGVQYLIGHNVDFDWKALGSPDVKRICTMAMARRRWLEDSHGLGACLYRVLPGWQARERLRNAHSADADVFNCYTLLQYLLQTSPLHFTSWEDVWFYSEECRIPLVWTFGKYKGKRIGFELPGDRADTGYHGWCLRQPDMDPYLHKALIERAWTKT